MSIDITALTSSLPEALVQTAGPLGLISRSDLPSAMQQELLGKLIALVRHTSGQHQTTLVWLGDLLAAQPELPRGRLTQIAKAADISPGALRNVKMVCTRIKPSWRRDELSWSHHMEVGLATDDEEQIKKWLDLAVQEKHCSIRDLRKMIRVRLSLKSSRKIPGDRSSPSFDVLRELHASARSLKRYRATWQNWTLKEWEQASIDLKALLEFAALLQCKLPAHGRSHS